MAERTALSTWAAGLGAVTWAVAAGAENRLIVAVYNYAEVPSRSLVEATGKAQLIFQRAGIKTEWVVCPRSMEELEQSAPRFTKCMATVGPGTPAIRITPRSKAEKLHRSGHELGLAARAENGRRSSYAYVFFHRVEEVAVIGDSTVPVVLGHAMAHELGHLLGVRNHSPWGLMRGNWLAADLWLAERGWLVFNGRQSKRMREGLKDRIAGETADQQDPAGSHWSRSGIRNRLR